jgi:hypothetical protein
MGEKNDEPVSDFATVAAGQTFELLGDVFKIEALDVSAPARPT